MQVNIRPPGSFRGPTGRLLREAQPYWEVSAASGVYALPRDLETDGHGGRERVTPATKDPDPQPGPDPPEPGTVPLLSRLWALRPAVPLAR